MRLLKVTCLFCLLGVSSLWSQDPDCCSWYRPYKTRSSLKFFIPEFSDQFTFKIYPQTGKLMFEELNTKSLNYEHPSLVIYESPITHTAFFCRMEDITQKKFGVMIQFHVGDYNSSMDRIIPR